MKTQNIMSVAIRGLAAVALSVGAVSSIAATWGSLDTCAEAATGSWASCTRSGTTFSYTGVTASSSTTAANANVVTSSGNGMYVNSDGDHGIDNSNGIDGIIFNFAAGVQLTAVDFGWTAYDYDASIYMWTGVGAPSNASPNSKAYGSSGWTLVSDLLAPENFNSSKVATINSSAYSSYWLISAYTGPNGYTDAFKLMAIAGNVCDKTLVGNECKTTTTPPPGNQVPEPGSLALLGLGAVGLIAARRRQQGQQRQMVLAA